MTLTVLALLCFCQAAAIDVDKLPKPTGYVSDLAHVVDEASKSQLEALCTSIEEQLGVQFAFVTVETLDNRPIRDVSLEIFRKWGVGNRKTNQGVLVLLAVRDRQNDIEAGRGIEPYLTDGFSGSTLRAMRPELRSGQYGSALLTAAHEMANQIAQGKNLPFTSEGSQPRRSTPERDRARGGIPFPLIIFGIFLLLWLFGRGGRRGGGPYVGGGGGGFLPGLILGNLLSGGGRRGGSDWGSGGGFGSDSGGGGGFGGFGGGDAGGGGASSNW